MVENPFVVYSPEDITPKEFKNIFIKEKTWINALETPKDIVIYGVRGSGKSMLLNYLEYRHQLYYYERDVEKFIKLNKGQKYFGVMVHATLENLNTTSYELLIKNKFCESDFIKQLAMTDLILAILNKIVYTFVESKEMLDYIEKIPMNEVKDFCSESLKRLDKRGRYNINLDDEDSNEKLLKVLSKIFIKERGVIEFYANDKLQLKDTQYEGNYLSFRYLHSFITRFKIVLRTNDFSFYILIDNGDEIKNCMQKCINDLISQRAHRDISIKLAIKKGKKWNWDGIQWPHDYSQIDIDELYSSLHTVYYKRIIEIANKRLELAGIDCDIMEFLPESKRERALLEKIKKEFFNKYALEYEAKSKLNKDLPTKSDYISNRVSKYAQAELFKRIKKTDKSYAGFYNVVNLSSGIVRQFLDLCSNMFDEEVKKKGEQIQMINLETQRHIIKKYANDFIDELEKRYKGLEGQGNAVEASLYRSLYTLIESLGNYYKDRLMEPELKEPRVFTFTLKDPNKSENIEKILELGVNENYFQTYWYSTKMGIGKYRGYAFNRRLCPRYGIDNISFRGRVELSTEDLEVAIDTGKIQKQLINKSKDVATSSLDSFLED